MVAVVPLREERIVRDTPGTDISTSRTLAMVRLLWEDRVGQTSPRTDR